MCCNLFARWHQCVCVLGEEIGPHNATAAELHWLKITEHIQFRLCVLAYRCLHGSAPSYLAETLHLTSDIKACRHLRSGSTSTLFVLATRRSSLGDRAFPVAAAWGCMWYWRARVSEPAGRRWCFRSGYCICGVQLDWRCFCDIPTTSFAHRRSAADSATCCCAPVLTVRPSTEGCMWYWRARVTEWYNKLRYICVQCLKVGYNNRDYSLKVSLLEVTISCQMFKHRLLQ